MASLNKVFLMGNLTRDPELRHTTSGSALCVFGLASSRRYVTSRGEEREDVCFVDVEVWGRQAESCQNYLTKGAPALIEGRLQFDQWEDRETGSRRSRLLVRADRVQFLRAPARGSHGFQGDEEGDVPRGPDRGRPSGPPSPVSEPGADGVQEDTRF